MPEFSAYCLPIPLPGALVRTPKGKVRSTTVVKIWREWEKQVDITSLSLATILRSAAKLTIVQVPDRRLHVSGLFLTGAGSQARLRKEELCPIGVESRRPKPRVAGEVLFLAKRAVAATAYPCVNR